MNLYIRLVVLYYRINYNYLIPVLHQVYKQISRLILHYSKLRVFK